MFGDRLEHVFCVRVFDCGLCISYVRVLGVCVCVNEVCYYCVCVCVCVLCVCV